MLPSPWHPLPHGGLPPRGHGLSRAARTLCKHSGISVHEGGRLHFSPAQRVVLPFAKAGEPIRDPQHGCDLDLMGHLQGPWGQDRASSMSVDTEEACPRPLTDEP